MRNLIVLGSTGSIGVNALAVAAHLGPDQMRIVGLSAHRRIEVLREQARQWQPRFVVVTDAAAHAELARDWEPAWGRLLGGIDGVDTMIKGAEADLVLQAMVGAAGLPASIQTVELGIDLAIANKESIVVAGPLIMAAARSSGARILPVDSEHAAIFQALAGQPSASVKRLLLTASGGPFRTTPVDQMADITRAEALSHPVWKMGAKITVDSSTMMNKALEVIEARWLFDVDVDRIEVVIHPQGVVHSLVEFVDGNVLAQLGPPDMKIPIQFALTYPHRLAGLTSGFSYEPFATLTFEPPCTERFPALDLGFEAARQGGTWGAAMNAANEVAVEAFLADRIGYTTIYDLVRWGIEDHTPLAAPDLEVLLRTDREVRARVQARIQA